PLGVVAIRAALVERERGIGETAYAVQRRQRRRNQLGQPVGDRRRYGLGRQLREQGQLAVRVERQLRLDAVAPRRSSTHPIGVSRSCDRSLSIAPETISRSIARVMAT